MSRTSDLQWKKLDELATKLNAFRSQYGHDDTEGGVIEDGEQEQNPSALFRPVVKGKLREYCGDIVLSSVHPSPLLADALALNTRSSISQLAPARGGEVIDPFAGESNTAGGAEVTAVHVFILGCLGTYNNAVNILFDCGCTAMMQMHVCIIFTGRVHVVGGEPSTQRDGGWRVVVAAV